MAAAQDPISLLMSIKCLLKDKDDDKGWRPTFRSSPIMGKEKAKWKLFIITKWETEEYLYVKCCLALFIMNLKAGQPTSIWMWEHLQFPGILDTNGENIIEYKTSQSKKWLCD